MKRRLCTGLLAILISAAQTASSASEWTVAADPDWRPVDASPTAMAAGSALDMSRFIDAPAGKHGRVVLNADGKLVFEKWPDRRIIFFGCSIAPHQILGEWCRTKDDIRQWAEQVRRQGYNLVRPHFLDHYLTGRSTADLEFDPEALDRFEYLVACLKENGVYLYLDAMTSWRGYKAGPGWTPQAKSEAFKSRIFSEDAVRDHWRAGVDKLLNRVNPYTKTRLADDPVVAFVLFFNEQNLNFYRTVPEHFNAPWRAWLRNKYGSTGAFRAAWTVNGRCLLGESATLDNAPVFEPRHLWQTDPRARDVALFVHDIHAGLLDWYVAAIREMKYPGLITHYDWLNHLGIQALRNRVPVISSHNYHAHPSDFTTPGSTISQESAIAAANRLFCSLATTRYGDRPLLITEYGQVFWNRYRYEEGLTIGAYSSFQDIDGLMVHATPVVPRINSAVRPFWAGHDPIGRASQVVAGFAHVRRDVTPSPRYVEIVIQKASVFDDVQHARAISAEQARLSLVTGVGLSYAGEPAPAPLRPRKADLRLPVFGTSEVRTREFFSEVLEDADGGKPLDHALALLRKAGVLDAANRTDPAKGVYAADTGELVLDAPSRRLDVIAPRMEGVCVDADLAPGRIVLKHLTVESTSVPASVTAVAADDLPLAESRRILLVYATDALNSGMTFDSPAREKLVSLGKLPVLLRTGRLHVTLTGRHAPQMKVWALGLDGRRAEQLEATADGRSLAVKIDTGLLNTVTPFFEIALSDDVP
jgi:hypothetical protein